MLQRELTIYNVSTYWNGLGFKTKRDGCERSISKYTKLNSKMFSIRPLAPSKYGSARVPFFGKSPSEAALPCGYTKKQCDTAEQPVVDTYSDDKLPASVA